MAPKNKEDYGLRNGDITGLAHKTGNKHDHDRTTLECTYRTSQMRTGVNCANWQMARILRECVRTGSPHRANSVTGVRTGANSVRIFGVTIWRK